MDTWVHTVTTPTFPECFSLYSELLSQSQKSHIRHFAVESFGFLLRKASEVVMWSVISWIELSCD